MAHDDGDERLHSQLWRAVQKLASDYTPYGEVDRGDPSLPSGGLDCSCGCRHFLVLADVGEQLLSYDWGVCINPASHRYGLLTFEHQGCSAFEHEEDDARK